MIFLCLLMLGACASGPETSPRVGQRYAIIQTSPGRATEGIFPVEIYNIDGKEINSRRTFHRIEPGKHSLNARAFVDQRALRGLSKDLTRGRSHPPLVYNFQSGVRYFIGLKADDTRSKNWQLVVWDQEELKSGQLKLD